MRERHRQAPVVRTLLSLLLPALPAVAQYPVQQDGHALDANPGIGQFGRNVGQPQSPLNAPNLMVTGNVTGGRSFRGFSPIRDVSAFGVNLPSAGLSFFQRETVSVNQVLGSGGVVTPGPFFSLEQTVPGAGAIIGGVTQPGFSTLPVTTVNPNLSYYNPGTTPATTLYQPVYDTRILNTGNALRPELLPNRLAPQPPLPPSQSLVNPALVRSPLLATNPNLSQRVGIQPSDAFGLTGTLDSGVGQLENPYADLGTTPGPFEPSALGSEDRNRFSVPSPSSPGAAAAGLSLGGAQASTGQPIDGRTGSLNQPALEPIDQRIDLRVDESGVFQSADGAGPAVPEVAPPKPVVPTDTSGTLIRPQSGSPASGTTDLLDARLGTFPIDRRLGSPLVEDRAREPGAATPPLAPPLPPDVNDQGLVYQPSADSPVALVRPLPRPEGAIGAGQEASGGPPAPAGANLESVPPPAGGQLALPSPEDVAAEPGQALADLAQPGGPDPRQMLNRRVGTFAGPQDNRLNHYLRTAESYLRQQEFFRAAGQYELASLVDPANPLVWLGRGHALLAAGDYVSAVRSLTRAMELYPDIGHLRYDLHDFLPDPSLLESRRADLEVRLGTQDDPELRFLLGYIEYHSGLKKFGLENLRRAASLSAADSPVARYASLMEAVAAQAPEGRNP